MGPRRWGRHTPTCAPCATLTFIPRPIDRALEANASPLPTTMTRWESRIATMTPDTLRTTRRSRKGEATANSAPYHSERLIAVASPLPPLITQRTSTRDSTNLCRLTRNNAPTRAPYPASGRAMVFHPFHLVRLHPALWSVCPLKKILAPFDPSTHRPVDPLTSHALALSTS